jgi:hypothetical protein
MADFYVVDGKKLIDFKPKHLNYQRAFQRICKTIIRWGNMTMQEVKAAYPENFKRTLYLLIKLKATSDYKLLKSGDVEFVETEFLIVEAICSMVGVMTPGEFISMFPVAKEFDGEKYERKDYFYTMNYIREFGMNSIIGENASEFLMEYWNWDITEFMVYWMEVVSQMHILQGGKDILLEFMEEQGVTPTYMYRDGEYMVDADTGERFKLAPKRNPLKKLFSIVE